MTELSVIACFSGKRRPIAETQNISPRSFYCFEPLRNALYSSLRTFPLLHSSSAPWEKKKSIKFLDYSTSDI